MVTGAQKHKAGVCPFCKMPPSEHFRREGFLHWVYVCEFAPEEWRGVFVDEPVDP